MLPAMKLTASAASTTDYAIGDIVTFAGHDWYIIGTESEGVTAPSGCYTLFAKNNDFGSAPFRAGASNTDSTANHYKDSDLQKKMEEIANGFSAGDKANIAARDTLDDIAGDSPTGQLLWPISEAEGVRPEIDVSLRAFPDNYWTRGYRNTEDVSPIYNGIAFSSKGGYTSDQSLTYGNNITNTYAVRPALYVKAQALPEKVAGIQVAFGGQWWYVVGQGENGSVPGPENTVTLFENPREAMGAQVILAQTNSSNYLGSDLQQKMADFSSNLNLAGKDSSLIVPRTLTSADGISGETAHDQPFWPLSKDEADRTDVEILKSELYDDVTFERFYWLRTTCDTTSWTTVYAVQGDTGDVTSDLASYNNGVRPAFYLDISDAFYLAKDAKRVTIGGNPYPLVLEGFEEYKYTIFDDSLKLSVTADPAQAAQTGETLSFGYVANTGKNQYLSCVLTPDGTTDVLYYNKLVELSDTAAASGTVNIPLTGVSNGNYTLRLYTEQENNRSTDFARSTVDVKITVKDGVTSIRDLGNLQLVGESGGQDGREVELRNNGTHIQWRYAGEDDSAWRDLVALDAITGGSGADGADGREVELRVDGGYIQWRYAGGEWQNLIALSALQGIKGDKGDPGDTPFIGENGNWWIGDTDTGIPATGDKGENGLAPYIGTNGNWWIGDTDTGIPATGDKGENGLTPYIGTNGNWWIGSTDTGIRAAGQNGKDGADGKDGQDGKDGIGIADLVINENGELVVTLTDGTVKNLGKVTGSDGVGIAKMEINSKGELPITLTNGTQLNAGALPVAAAAESSQTLVYVSLGTAGVSFAGMLGMLLFLLKKKKA